MTAGDGDGKAEINTQALINLYDYSKLGELSKESITWLYWFSDETRIRFPPELQSFFQEVLIYYRARKQLEGGIDWMEHIPRIDHTWDESFDQEEDRISAPSNNTQARPSKQDDAPNSYPIDVIEDPSFWSAASPDKNKSASPDHDHGFSSPSYRPTTPMDDQSVPMELSTPPDPASSTTARSPFYDPISPTYDARTPMMSPDRSSALETPAEPPVTAARMEDSDDDIVCIGDHRMSQAAGEESKKTRQESVNPNNSPTASSSTSTSYPPVEAKVEIVESLEQQQFQEIRRALNSLQAKKQQQDTRMEQLQADIGLKVAVAEEAQQSIPALPHQPLAYNWPQNFPHATPVDAHYQLPPPPPPPPQNFFINETTPVDIHYQPPPPPPPPLPVFINETWRTLPSNPFGIVAPVAAQQWVNVPPRLPTPPAAIPCAFCFSTTHPPERCNSFDTNEKRVLRLRQLNMCGQCLGTMQMSCLIPLHRDRMCLHCGFHRSHIALCRSICP